MRQEQIQDRIRALCAYIEGFKTRTKEKDGIELEVNAKAAAEDICMIYDRYAESVVRPSIDSGIIQVYKIIANTELCVMLVSPILISNEPDKEKEYNARLSLYIALAILMDWHEVDSQKMNVLLADDKQLQDFLREHFIWLKNLDSRYQFPIFSNSQVWRLFSYLIADRIKNMAG